jgi:DNA processing protein
MSAPAMTRAPESHHPSAPLEHEPRDVVAGSAEYPGSLARLPDAPVLLRVRGSLPPWERAVAIVGTRSASERGLALAGALARELGARGCPIVSGGAAGIDHAAHLGALEAGAPTVVVHGSGLARPYPAAHRALYPRIVAAGGAELSELPDELDPRAFTFLQRNRIIAALARVVVIVEAPLRSGALSTAAHARALGVPVLVVPRVPAVAEAQGSNALLRAGAGVCLDEEDVLARLDADGVSGGAQHAPRTRRRPGSAPAVPADLSALGRRVLDAIVRGASDLEQVVENAAIRAAEAQVALAELELAGLVAVSPVGRLEALG